ncbi:formimidoylglutamate deiminase [Kocuria marina]|uniref:formimidoylglutamate deiminase n=1 Tax=Kocuria marina TaxID=223184 RepID=UPI0022E4CDB2|nr:formimidoylglutamate deiminase [Kocuria marina]
MTRRQFVAEHAWLGGNTPARNVLIEVDGDRITSVIPDAQCPEGATWLAGLTLPGFVNGHSHVFHRAIRGHSQHGVGSFWAWRELMYEVAGSLDPDSLYELARATYAEMALAGVTSVGEFFYVHHDPQGRPYDDPNAMSHAIVRAAEDAGLRITLLDTCYLQGGVDGRELEGVQRRFTDGSWQAWAERVAALPTTATTRPGAAIHSVRAVPRSALAPIAEFARGREMPIHAHVSEQPAENQDTLDRFGLTPTALLAEAGVLGPDMTSVHATHLSPEDVAAYGTSRSTICMCCTTERDLGDGVGPADLLRKAGARLSVGSDAHMMIDLLEEARAIELDLRVTSGSRGHLGVAELATALTAGGAASLGWDAGSIEVGRLADFAVVDLTTPRTAGAAAGDVLAHVIFAAQAGDVRTVVRGGEIVVDEFRSTKVPDAGRELDRVITALLS